MSLLTGARSSSLGNSFWTSLTVFGVFCYFHFVIKTRATCRPKSRCQSDLSTVSVLANKNLHQDLMHSGCRGTAVPNVCLQAFSLFPLPSSPLNQRPVHRLHNRHFMSQARRIRHFKRSVIARADEKIKCLLPIHCSGSSHVHYMNDTLQLGNWWHMILAKFWPVCLKWNAENGSGAVIFFWQCCSRSSSFISKCSRNNGKTK